MRIPPSIPCVLILLCYLNPLPCPADVDDPRDAGIREYLLENYEEVIELLSAARRRNPSDSAVAFFLGMAHKKAMNYPEARIHLTDAVSMKVKIKEALLELIDVLCQLPGEASASEALKWIAVAEQESIAPARTAFLKGQVLQKQGRGEEAIAAFEKARDLDPALGQAAEFQIGIILLGQKDLVEARKRFRTATLKDPDTDLASFAQSYQEIVANRSFEERPLRFTLRAAPFYDSNMVLKPTWGVAAAGITDEESFGLATGLTVDWVPRLSGNWLLSAQYDFYATFHEKHEDTHDVLANSVSLLTGYDFGRFSLNLNGYYSNFLLGRPDYNRYLDDASVGILARMFLSPRTALDLFGGWGFKSYAIAPLIPEEDRDGNGFRGYASVRGLFYDRLFYGLLYECIREDTDGPNWENTGHRFQIEATWPFTESLRLRLSLDEMLQYFDNEHPLIDEDREDHINIATAELTWTFCPRTDLILSYIRTRANSNVGLYDYDRTLVALEVEYRF